MPRLLIRLLGGFQVEVGGAPVVDFKSDRVRALLVFLAVESNRPHSRDALANLLWPDSSNQVARTNLRSTLANLRKVIQDTNTSPAHLLINRETIQFNKDSDYWLDMSIFLSVSAEVRIDPAHGEQLEKMVELYQGPFLSGFSFSDSALFEEWVLLKQEEINRHMVAVLCSLADYYELDGTYDKAQIYARKIVEVEPWNEEAHQRLIRTLAFSGQRSAALAQYEACRKSLAKELDVEPSPETIALYEAIRDGKLVPFPPIQRRDTTGIQSTTSEAGKPLFVGRQAELDTLDRFLQKTLAGNGQVVFVTGSSGSGKTALMRAFVQRSMQTYDNLIVVSGNGNAYTGIGDPYLPFIEILGQLIGDMMVKQGGGAIFPQYARRLLAMLPIIGQILVELGPDLINRMVSGEILLQRVVSTAHTQGAWQEKLKALVENRKAGLAGDDIQQIDLFEQFSRVLLSLAQRNPLILILDDLQWADTGSISLLFHLGRRITDSRILILGAYRAEEVALGWNGGRHPLEAVQLEFQRAFGNIQVNLDQSDGQAFVEAFLNSEPNPLDLVFRDKLFHHTNGHPLFTIELLRSLQERGDLTRDETGQWTGGNQLSWDQLPGRVEAVIAERIGRLSQDLRQVLEVASVEGEEFTAEVIADVLNMDEKTIIRQLSEQVERKHRLVTAIQFRRIDGQKISRYRFQHQLFQTYLYGSLNQVERAYFHDAVGGTLERLYREHPEKMDFLVVGLTRHYEAAGLFQEAIDCLQKVGKRAERMSASNEASAHYRHALILCRELPDTLERSQTEITLSMALGAQLVASGGYLSVEAEQIYTRVHRVCQDLTGRLTDPHQAAKQMIPVLLELGAFHGHRAQYQAAREIYDQILGLAQASGDPEAMMFADWGPGYLLVAVGEFLTARSHLEKALEAYGLRKQQGQATIFTLDMGVSCLSWLSWALFLMGYPDQALLRSREAVSLAREIFHPFSLAVALTIASILHGKMLDMEGTRSLADEAIAICREKGFLYWLSLATVYRGLALAWQGEYEEGISQMREGERVWRASGAYIGLAEYHTVLAEVFGKAGQVKNGLSLLEEAREMVDQSGELIYAAELYRIKGELLLKISNENQAKAETCFREAVDIAHNQQAKTLELRAIASLSRLLAKQGRRDEAREMLAGIYHWFTEGFQTKDLKSASDLLLELS